MDELAYLIGKILGAIIMCAIMIFPLLLIVWLIVKYANKKRDIILQQNQTQNGTITEQSGQELNNNLPYILNQNFLTNKEYKFYKSLKPIADKYGLEIICKVRLADLVIIPKNINNYMKWFNHIKAKHIDFVLCSSEMKPVLLIEVDDYTHQWNNRQRRDEFVDSIFNGTAIKLIHILTWTNEQLEEQIKTDLPYSETAKES